MTPYNSPEWDHAPALFGLYPAFTFFDKATVNLLISVHFCLVGLAALTTTFGQVLHSMDMGPKPKIMKHPLPKFIGGKSISKIGVDIAHW